MDLGSGDLLRFSPPGTPSPPESESLVPQSRPPTSPTQPQLLLDLGQSLPTCGCVTSTENPTPVVNDKVKVERECLLDLTDLDHGLSQVSEGSLLSSHETAIALAATSSLPHESNCEDSGSEDNEDKYRLESVPAAPRKLTEKKRHDSAVFQSFLHRNENIIGGGRREQPAGVDAKNLDSMPAAAIARKSQSQQIIASPREYQIELFERAKERNTIVVLDTGSGKTLIAILLLRHVVEQEFERRAAGGERKVAFFVVSNDGPSHMILV